jgi:radical SAM superfamily enzyme with C-terminal helix-hairpin-helix motif|tara:strand:+ start:3934 stop:5739 length:1806 start_codon:yes stop_codon:yes gene_type:complete
MANTDAPTDMEGWLVIDGYEDEPAAFGVPNYLGFHIRYICGVLESRGIPYTYMTVDQWRLKYKHLIKNKIDRDQLRRELSNLSGTIVLAGSIVPGKYVRGTPISQKELDEILAVFPKEQPILCGGWAIKNWRYSGWTPLRSNLFCAVNDIDASLNDFISTGTWKHSKRTQEQWSLWAHHGSKSKAVTDHPDLLTEDGRSGPLTYEIELYQGCVRFKRGCKFCIEPKKGVPLWRSEEDVLREISSAIDSGVRNIRIGGATDIYTYRAEGVRDLEYPIPNPEPISKVLYGARDDERLEILHVDNGNPSIVAENIEPSTEITKCMIDTLSDGAVLSFGLESADPKVHEMNWLNCDSEQLKIAIRHINDFGRFRGERGLPKLLPGLNFIAGLNGENKKSYALNLRLLEDLRSEGLWLRRINIRQVEGQGFQEISEPDFHSFKKTVRERIDKPLLEEMFPTGLILNDIWWETHGDRIRIPEHVLNPIHRDPSIYGKSGITFGRQIGAYPILVGVPYQIPLEKSSDILVTGHGMRSISGVEIGLNINSVSQQQLESIPGIGKKAAWRIISTRAKASRKSEVPFESVAHAFEIADLDMPLLAEKVLTI